MNKQFLTSKDVTLLNGGYLSNANDKKPIFNPRFYAAQRHAEYIVTFAEKAKGKDFVGKQADSLESLKLEVEEVLNSKDEILFVKKPKEVKRKLNEQLFEEAMAFTKYQESSSKVDKVNNFLNTNFTVLKEFEEYGLFFEEEIVKLDKIYTLREVVKAVQEVIELLD